MPRTVPSLWDFLYITALLCLLLLPLPSSLTLFSTPPISQAHEYYLQASPNLASPREALGARTGGRTAQFGYSRRYRGP